MFSRLPVAPRDPLLYFLQPSCTSVRRDNETEGHELLNDQRWVVLLVHEPGVGAVHHHVPDVPAQILLRQHVGAHEEPRDQSQLEQLREAVDSAEVHNAHHEPRDDADECKAIKPNRLLPHASQRDDEAQDHRWRATDLERHGDPVAFVGKDDPPGRCTDKVQRPGCDAPAPSRLIFGDLAAPEKNLVQKEKSPAPDLQ